MPSSSHWIDPRCEMVRGVRVCPSAASLAVDDKGGREPSTVARAPSQSAPPSDPEALRVDGRECCAAAPPSSSSEPLSSSLSESIDDGTPRLPAYAMLKV